MAGETDPGGQPQASDGLPDPLDIELTDEAGRSVPPAAPMRRASSWTGHASSEVFEEQLLLDDIQAQAELSLHHRKGSLSAVNTSLDSFPSRLAPSRAPSSLASAPSSSGLAFVWSQFTQELTGEYEEGEDTEEKKDSVYNFVHVPLQLEKFLTFGLLLCVDAFLFLFTFLPLRILTALPTLLRRPFTGLSGTQVWDLLRGAIVLSCFGLLLCLDASRIYHHIRGQAVIKLYVIFNVLEILDKLCCSFGQDIFDSLHARTVQGARRAKKQPQTLQPHLHPYTLFGVALFYTFIHSLILFFQAITLNVAINSHNNALFTLLISNQFVELKGCVFKRFEKENLFQMSCSDMVERFQLGVFLVTVTLQNLSDLGWYLSEKWASVLAEAVLTVWLSECLVDWIKHAFITKFNHISPEVYPQFDESLKAHLAVTLSPAQRYVGDSHTVCRRIGFVPLPLACLVLRVCSTTLPLTWCVRDCLLFFFGFVLLCALKALLRTQLVRLASKHRASTLVTSTPIPNRFTFVNGKMVD